MGTAMALEKIGRYEIVGQLGKGAMGIVYKALDPTIGRTVALKTMRLDVQGPETSELLARFRNEARLAGVLNHPNIVTIYDAGEINGLFYMAMEYIEGKTLYQLLLQEHALTMEKVLDLAMGVKIVPVSWPCLISRARFARDSTPPRRSVSCIATLNRPTS